MRKAKKRAGVRPKRRTVKDDYDEEIPEDEDIGDLLPKKPKQSRDAKKDREGGELWKYIYENGPIEDDEEIESADEAPEAEKEADLDRFQEKDVEDFCDRLEDDGNMLSSILDPNQVEDIEPSFQWITKATEPDDSYSKLVNKFKQIEEDVPELLKSESQTKTNRIERTLHYESAKKVVTSKWAPIVADLNRPDRKIRYGEDLDNTDPSCNVLSATFQPETDFEHELSAAVEGDNKQMEEHTGENLIEGKALARAILAREQKKNKRINRIKSKRWHKRQKQRDLQVAAKLLSKIDDPELASDIRNSFEKKRAERRVLRKKEAQSKWAKLALRYGGKDLIKEISTQHQNLRNEEAVIKSATGPAEPEDDEDEEDDEEEEEEDPSSPYSKLEVIADPTVPIPKKGLFNLRFMRDAIETQREAMANGVKEAEEEEENDESSEDGGATYDFNVDFDQEGNEYGNKRIQKLIKIDKKPKEELPQVSKEELEQAMKEIDDQFGDDDFESAGDVQLVTNVASVAYGSTIIPSSDDTRVENVESPKKEKIVTKNAEHVPEKGNYTSLPKDTGKSLANYLAEDTSLDNLISTLEVPQEGTANEKLVKELFVTRPDEDNYLQDSSDDEKEETGTSKMSGWGSWTGFGIDKKKKVEEEKKEKKKSLVKVTKKKDPKVAKYFIHNLPHPFNNRHEYNSKMEIPLGPEWNTMNMHEKLTEPKVSVKVGSVVMPLGLGKKSHKQLLHDYGKRIIKNRTRARL
ncbi:conserved hypothetical protein [Theileria equi strain WA]|uniref:Uncharacterized protein n=1 Tax=Theileria equi strain WA TaxID=1537102 RepID=L1LER4_THEEQ|nr:conserved hypothetical protein [Theileria equi strain WA]EKX73826.1 conserved hypothetical protein [Theileria equi strain WA]|eukprot:XP_004833278.1 conserved hypothetical protein [Theileria equi strain WA]